MKAKASKTNQSDIHSVSKKKDALQGYPLYPSSEDIFNNSKAEIELEIDPEDISKNKNPNDISDSNNEKDFLSDVSGGDLDFPDTELDDAQKNAGIEDEENSLYSIGGDDHNNLDENQGE